MLNAISSGKDSKLLFFLSVIFSGEKRLEKGKFDWPEEVEGMAKVALSATELAALVDGLELTRTRAKVWWRKKMAA